MKEKYFMLIFSCKYGTAPGQVDRLVWNSRSRLYWHLCVISNGNELEIVTNQMNLNTNLDLSKIYWIKTYVTGNYI